MIRSRRMKLVLGALLILVLLVVVFVTVVIPVLRGSTGEAGAVVDISSEPQTTWSYDWAGDSNPEFLDDSPEVNPVGDTQALVWPVFDLAAYEDEIGTSFGWYEGYDQQYDDGYAAGLEFRDADEAYGNDTFPYTVPPAHEEDYFPEGVYDNYDEFLGFQDGFYDAAGSLGAGASKREKPVDPGYRPVVTLIGIATGEPEWSVDLADELDGVDYSSAISAFDIEGSNAVAVMVESPNSDEVGSSLLTLDKRNGEVLSQASTPGSFDVAAFDGDIVVSASNAVGTSSTIGRYAADRLDSNPRWEVEIEDSPFLFVHGDFVIAYGEYAGAVFLGDDGKKAPWGEDIDYSTDYQFVGDHLIRAEYGEDGGDSTIQGWNLQGEPTWTEPTATDYAALLDDHIFTMDVVGDEFAHLQRINPLNGAPMWAVDYADEFDALLGVHGGALLISRGNTIVVIDPDIGTQRLTQSVGDFRDVFEGERLYYVPAGEVLAAYDYGREGAVWSLGLESGQSITTLGNRLVLVDSESLSLHGLAAK